MVFDYIGSMVKDTLIDFDGCLKCPSTGETAEDRRLIGRLAPVLIL